MLWNGYYLRLFPDIKTDADLYLPMYMETRKRRKWR